MEIYETTYPNGRKFRYAMLTAQQKYALRTIEPERSFVSETNAIIIKRALSLVELSDDELTYVRNSVVHMFTEIAEYERLAAEMESQKGNKSNDHWCAHNCAMTRMSMVTAIIDNEKWNRGLPV